MALKLRVNVQKYCTNPKNDCTFFSVVATGHLCKVYNFELLMHIPLAVISKPSNIVLLYKKLHFLSLKPNVYLYNHVEGCCSGLCFCPDCLLLAVGYFSKCIGLAMCVSDGFVFLDWYLAP